MIGQVVKVISEINTVDVNGKLYECRSRGLFRKEEIIIRVGDFVKIDENNIIYELLPRKNEFIRPFVSNIDQAFLITSFVKPKFSSNLLDKFLVQMEYHDVRSIICFTKEDLLNEQEKDDFKEIINYYNKIGYTVVINHELNKISNLLKDKTTVFTGQTGVGKSTLLNNLDESLNLKTGEISEALGRGKHTTRHVELINIKGGKVLDTPGFSAFTFNDIEPLAIRDGFIEFKNYECQFNDCLHENEIKCGVKQATTNGEILQSRYDNYLKIIKEAL